ncbi:MAG: Spy/CpxP family protein refolding chaperone, partial [Gemmatimonadaceae bacterium]
AYSSADSRSTDPYLRVPSGRVTVASNLEDGTLGVSTLQFGVNPSLPQESQSRLTEMSDEVSRVARNASHRIKLGGLLNQETSQNGSFANALGTFTFNSLADFEAGRAASYTRTLSNRDRSARTINGAVYLGDSWRRSQKLQFTYGARLETSVYPDAPAFNPAIDSVFGARTDRFPSEFHVSPRVGFTYNYGQAQNGPAMGAIRGGIGEFRGRAPSQLFASAADANGLANGQSQIVCVGSTVPVPDWRLFINNPSTVPESCNGLGQQLGTTRRNVTVFGDDFGAPRAWRGSLGMNRRFAERFNLSLDASFAHGVSQTSATDLNLNTVPRFSLAGEAGRPVYSPITSIVPSTGAIALAGSRIEPRFGVVSQINSDLSSDTKQLTASFSGITTKAIVLNASYTYTRSIDETQGISTFGGGGGFGGGFGGGSGGSTAGNPNLTERATSDQERRHSLVGTITWPIKPVMELTAIARLSSGASFTPNVSGDINGDGLRNDRPFIYDPASAPDTALANGMSRLMSTAPPRARECLQSQMLSIASRNSCSAPWSPSFDLQANIKPNNFGLQRKLTISIVGLNTLSGIDQLLHGSDNLRGWGQPAFADRTLLYVRGFDPVAKKFNYQVNEHFGAANGSRNAFRVPFQLAIQARLALGVDPARQQMNAALGGGRGGRQSVEALRERMARAIPNPFRQIMDVNDSAKLELTADQKAKLTVMGDSLQLKADTLIGSLAQTLGSTDARTAEPMQLMLKMRTRIQEGRTLATKAIKDAEAVLTPEQWAKVPKEIKEPFNRGGREGGGGFGPPGG